MSRQEIITKLTDEYAALRLSAEREALEREAYVVSVDEAAARILAQRSQLPLNSLKQMLAERENGEQIAKNMLSEGLRLNAELRARLEALGLGADYLKPRYVCDMCKDTGYTAGAPAKMCICFEKRLRAEERALDSAASFERQNFSMFDENFIPDAPVSEGGASQRALAKSIRDLCEEYADLYPNTIKPNLMLMGEVGLGKSFLLNCIAERVEARGFAATPITAYKLLEAMRERHYHLDNDEGAFERLINCELLLIDDLGCEPMLKNVTQEYMFALLNERLNKQKHTVIATNLLPTQLKERYGERIMSRLCDKSMCDSVRLLGVDLRRK